MLTGIQWMASAMLSAKAKLEIATDNLANASSDGFRKHLAATFASARGIKTVAALSPEKGPVRFTGRTLDLALIGDGSFFVAPERNPHLRVATRSGAFACDRDGYLVDVQGRSLVGKNGFVRLPGNAAPVESDGTWRVSGNAVAQLALPRGTTVRSGFLETSNVNSIGEMVGVIDAQRAFETAQKTLVAIDETRSKAANDMGRIK
jgi:flagellar basal-body rod protein FlgF